MGSVALLSWAALVPLPSDVALQGVVTPNGNKKAVEARGQGVIDQINVSEGDMVRAGDVLVRLDATSTVADYHSLQARHKIAKETATRVRAELASSNRPGEAKALDESTPQLDPLHRQILKENLAIDALTRMGAQSELEAAKKKRHAATLSLGYKKRQLELSSEQLAGLQRLTFDGYLSRHQLIGMEREHLSLQAEVAQEQAAVAIANESIKHLSSRLSGASHTSGAQRLDSLVMLDREMEVLKSALTSARVSLESADVRAPVAGTVVALAVHTRGGVVRPGQLLMEIVPSGSSLEVTGRLPVGRVDEVELGTNADLYFTAMDRNSTPKRHGRVKRVSADRTTDERSGEPYYTVVISFQNALTAAADSLPLKPGMPVEIRIRTKERTLLSKLLKPVIDRTRTELALQ
ncbi:HlyD family type I secretion periplasmic adaptor subunit [Stenotrophomonas sp. VV52]|uniref:HlyD family type I secretion periplasmic adaptor subunit n=1 Tax=Stenotrophomonas sp. VV52 TaxID=2066958 RepID=UPI00263BC8B1|nr:HlyD family type I secretion periplasmic adaptor subunit [Stenotrophomonas sp. VV52]